MRPSTDYLPVISMNSADLSAFICSKFSQHVGLSEVELFGEDLSLAAIIHRSERLANSVDLMEAFARTANGLRKEHGVRVRLPTLALDTPISTVLQVFLAEAVSQPQPVAQPQTQRPARPVMQLAGGL
jgi:hypothetical protein